MTDFDDYPRISEQPTYRIHQIGHRCALGDISHSFEECGQYCVNLLIGLDSKRPTREHFEVYVDSSSEPAIGFLRTRDRAVAEAFVQWLEEA